MENNYFCGKKKKVFFHNHHIANKHTFNSIYEMVLCLPTVIGLLQLGDYTCCALVSHAAAHAVTPPHSHCPPVQTPRALYLLSSWRDAREEHEAWQIHSRMHLLKLIRHNNISQDVHSCKEEKDTTINCKIEMVGTTEPRYVTAGHFLA